MDRVYGYRVVYRCEARLRKLASGMVCGDREIPKFSYVGRQGVDSGYLVYRHQFRVRTRTGTSGIIVKGV